MWQCCYWLLLLGKIKDDATEERSTSKSGGEYQEKEEEDPGSDTGPKGKTKKGLYLTISVQ